QPTQRAVPGGGVECILARRVRWPDYRRRGYAAWAQNPRASAADRRRPRSLEMTLPEQLSLVGVNPIDVVRNAGDNHDLFVAARRIDAADNQGGQQVVHLAWLVIELDLPQQLHVLDIGCREDLFVLLPGGPLRVAAVSQPVRGFAAGQPVRAHAGQATTYHRD